MEENKHDELEEEIIDNQSEDDSQDGADDEIDTLKSRLAELESENTKYKRIAQQKEKKLQQAKEHNQPTQFDSSASMSPKDLIALSRSGYDDEVLEEALEYAKFKKIDIKEALNSNFIKAIASEKEEYKRTAEATATKPNRSSTRGRDDTLVSNSSRGVVPDNDEDIMRLAQLRMKKR